MTATTTRTPRYSMSNPQVRDVVEGWLAGTDFWVGKVPSYTVTISADGATLTLHWEQADGEEIP